MDVLQLDGGEKLQRPFDQGVTRLQLVHSGTEQVEIIRTWNKSCSVELYGKPLR